MEEGDQLRRDLGTWLGYSLVGLFAYLLYGLGAATPYLKTEFGLSDAVAGLHATAFALGATCAGATGERFVRIVGNARCLWLSAAAAALSGLGLAVFRNPDGTLAAALCLGFAASLLLAIVNASLTEGHPRWSAVVLTEAQVFASVCSLATALVIGAAASGPVGWRAAMVVPVVCVVGLFAVGRSWTWQPRGAVLRAAAPARLEGRLPGRFWIRWLVVVLVIGLEFGVVFWGPDILRQKTGMPAGLASASMGLFIGGMLVGRILGARLAARASFASRLMPMGLGLVCGGAIFAWIAPASVLLQAALIVMGLGVSNLYPQAVDAAIKASGDRDVIAAARCSLAFGVALLFGPLMLGAVGDRFGVVTGLWLVAAVSATALLLHVAARPVQRPELYDTRQV
jgi:predicted MFS family arabinose efflux permease